ncbi:MAG: hypothetical protein NTY74_11050 [Ignavibacteriae bacterium]|nr:hypothetical protein [Ignavibacteriota bacterium]
MGDQYVVGMMAMKNVQPKLYETDYLYSDVNNYKYYNPVFVKILEVFYYLTDDIVEATQVLNTVLVFIYTVIFTILLNKVFKRKWLSLLLVLISLATVVSVVEGELWGYFISYNANARGTYAVLLLFVLCLFVWLKNRKYYNVFLIILFSLLGAISSIHPPTGLAAGLCSVMFFFIYKFLNKEYIAYKWLIVSCISFCVFFFITSVLPFRGNENPFKSANIIFNNYYFIFDYVNSLNNDTLKNSILGILSFAHPEMIILIYSVSSVILLALLKSNKLNINKYFVLSGVCNLPFIFYAICLPIIQTMLNFPIKPHLLIFIGFIPLLIYVSFLYFNFKNCNKTSFIVQLLTTSLIFSTFGFSLFLTYYVNIINKDMLFYVESSLRGMRFFYILLPFMIMSILIGRKKLYAKLIIIVLPIFFVYQIFMQDKIYSQMPDDLLNIAVGAKKEYFQLKWVNDSETRPLAMNEAANWLLSSTENNSLILFFPQDYYMESPKLKCLSKRSFIIDQSSITQYSRNIERDRDYKQLISGNTNFAEYISKYKPDYIVKDKQVTYSQNMNYAVVFENEIYKIYKVKENQ